MRRCFAESEKSSSRWKQRETLGRFPISNVLKQRANTTAFAWAITKTPATEPHESVSFHWSNNAPEASRQESQVYAKVRPVMATTLIAPMPDRSPQAHRRVPPLQNGDHLSAREFLRRYEAMPEVKKAELIDGIVYLGSPVRIDQHGEPDALIQGWLCNYSVATAGVKHATNSTTRLGPDDV